MGNEVPCSQFIIKEHCVQVLKAETVYEALIANEAIVEGLKKVVLRYRLDLNARTSAYLRLSSENDVFLLSALLWAWFETLKVPVLTKDHLAYIVISADKPQICLKRLEPVRNPTPDIFFLPPSNETHVFGISNNAIRSFNMREYSHEFLSEFLKY